MRLLRSFIVVAVSCGSLVLGTAASSALAPRGNDPCSTLVPLQASVDELKEIGDYDVPRYRTLGADFKKAAKSGPKELRSAMKKLGKLYASVGKTNGGVDALNAYGRGVVKYDTAIRQFSAYFEENCAASTGGGSSTSSGSGAGTLTLGSETITLESSRCFLEEQTAAGQKISWTAQASGTNAAGDGVIVDVSRYDAASDFAGDDVSIDIGDPRDPSFVEWNGRYTSGVIFLSGKTVSASGLEIDNDDLATETASFEINC